MQKKVLDILEIISRHDVETWENMIHPNCDESIRRLDYIEDLLLSKTIVLTDHDYHVSVTFFENIRSRWDGKSTIEADVISNGKTFQCVIVIKKDSVGEGIYSFLIT
jgi:hypothetical protein